MSAIQAYADQVVPQPGRPVRIAVLDDYEIVVAGITALLAPYADRLCVVELDEARRLPEDLDIVLYDTFGHAHDHEFDIAELTSGGSAKVVVFSWNVEPGRIAHALAQGAAGYVAKSLSADEIVVALERVHAGEAVIPPVAAARSIAETVAWPGRDHGLSHREAEVLALIAKGLSNQEIATRLFLSINSVKTYIRTAYQKIDVSRRAQAVGWAIAHGFPSDDDRATTAVSDQRPALSSRVQ